MKKLILGLILALTIGALTSCQKGESFFNGTWQAVSYYEYKDSRGDWHNDICTIELTLTKKSGEATLVSDCPHDRDQNLDYKGTYTFYNDNTVAVTFRAKYKDENDWMIVLHRSTEDDSRLWGDDYYFTKVKNK